MADRRPDAKVTSDPAEPDAAAGSVEDFQRGWFDSLEFTGRMQAQISQETLFSLYS